MEEGYTVIRVKRKVTEDPERGLQLSAKKRKIDASNLKFEYAGSLPLGSDAEKAIEVAKTPTRKRTASHLGVVRDAFQSIKNKLSPKVPRKTAPAKAESARVYDIIHEEIENRKENTITLNGAAMIREKLNISDREQELNEYVYDIYYAPRNMEISREELYFEAVNYDYSENYRNDKPDWEEEEDSNDEDNWRNDYPEESSTSYDSEDLCGDGCGDYGINDRFDYASDDSRNGFDPCDDIGRSDDD